VVDQIMQPPGVTGCVHCVHRDRATRSPLTWTHQRARRPQRAPGGRAFCCLERKVEFRPATFRLRDGCSASTWTALDGSRLLTLDASSVQTALEGSRRIVWMIIGMIKAHPTESRMAGRASESGLAPASADNGSTYRRWALGERLHLVPERDRGCLPGQPDWLRSASRPRL
jgi:hypothetical protein